MVRHTLHQSGGRSRRDASRGQTIDMAQRGRPDQEAHAAMTVGFAECVCRKLVEAPDAGPCPLTVNDIHRRAGACGERLGKSAFEAWSATNAGTRSRYCSWPPGTRRSPSCGRTGAARPDDVVLPFAFPLVKAAKTEGAYGSGHDPEARTGSPSTPSSGSRAPSDARPVPWRGASAVVELPHPVGRLDGAAATHPRRHAVGGGHGAEGPCQLAIRILTAPTSCATGCWPTTASRSAPECPTRRRRTRSTCGSSTACMRTRSTAWRNRFFPTDSEEPNPRPCCFRWIAVPLRHERRAGRPGRRQDQHGRATAPPDEGAGPVAAAESASLMQRATSCSTGRTSWRRRRSATRWPTPVARTAVPRRTWCGHGRGAGHGARRGAPAGVVPNFGGRVSARHVGAAIIPRVGQTFAERGFGCRSASRGPCRCGGSGPARRRCARSPGIRATARTPRTARAGGPPPRGPPAGTARRPATGTTPCRGTPCRGTRRRPGRAPPRLHGRLRSADRLRGRRPLVGAGRGDRHGRGQPRRVGDGVPIPPGDPPAAAVADRPAAAGRPDAPAVGRAGAGVGPAAGHPVGARLPGAVVAPAGEAVAGGAPGRRAMKWPLRSRNGTAPTTSRRSAGRGRPPDPAAAGSGSGGFHRASFESLGPGRRASAPLAGGVQQTTRRSVGQQLTGPPSGQTHTLRCLRVRLPLPLERPSVTCSVRLSARQA